MAKLIIKSLGGADRAVILKSGPNRFGRTPDNDISIEHPTISSLHCVIEYRDDALWVKDCGSTNGTFLNDIRIDQGILESGQRLRLGEVEMLVEEAEVVVAIPHIEVQVAAPPVVRTDGSVMCRKHENVPAKYRCTHCQEILCSACVHCLRRKKGKSLLLCPLCSFPVEPIGGPEKKKRSLMGYLFKTVKIPLFGSDKTQTD